MDIVNDREANEWVHAMQDDEKEKGFPAHDSGGFFDQILFNIWYQRGK